MGRISLRVYDSEIAALIEQGQRIDEAIAHCAHILAVFPRHLETHRLLAKACLESKRFEQAVDSFERVLDSVPEDFVSHVGLSVIAADGGRLDDAIWHMERAFEVQPSNAAIQGELQRLFGRRDGAEPPKVRLTRGALAHMYMQGELFSQAITEARAVLSHDPKRADMQCLLAKAYFWNGQRGEAIQVWTDVLRRYPYSLAANRLMLEAAPVTGPEESILPFRQRLLELDPYEREGGIDTGGVANNEVMLDRLENADLGAGDDTVQRHGLLPASPEIEGDSGAPVRHASAVAQHTLNGSGPRLTDDMPPFLRGPNRATPRPDLKAARAKYSQQIESLLGGTLPDFPRWMRPSAVAGEGDPAAHGVSRFANPPDWLRKVGRGPSSAPDRGEAESITWTDGPGHGTESPVQKAAHARAQGAVSGPGVDVSPNLNSSGTSPEGNDDDLAWLENLSKRSPRESDGLPNDLDANLAFDSGSGMPAVDEPVGPVTEDENAWTPITQELDAPDWLTDAKPRDNSAGTVEGLDRHERLGVAESVSPAGMQSEEEAPAWLRDDLEPNPEVAAGIQPADWRPPEHDQWSGADNFATVRESKGPIDSRTSVSQPSPSVRAKPKAGRAPVPAGEALVSLADAQSALGRGNIPAAMDAYGKLIRKGRSVVEIIRDLRDAVYRYPVEVSVWQALGDAYMRANRLQEALDAYTKAEELLP